MTQTRWAIDAPEDEGLELGGRKFSSNDEGAPMMCNLVCSTMGRHVHIDYCRAGVNSPCTGAEVQHINTRMVPEPDRNKDAVTHSLYWRRMGTLHTSFMGLPRFNAHLQDSKVTTSTLTISIETDTYHQTRTLAMSRRILGNGAPLLVSRVN